MSLEKVIDDKISELLIGSTARKVINSSKIPVLVIPLGN